MSLHVENPNRVKLDFHIRCYLNMTYHQMFVHSDVVDYTYVGNITVPIFRIVSYKQSKSSTQSRQEFVNLHWHDYVPLAKSYNDQVHIDIKDEIGRSVLLSISHI